jgi:hypothetical protein
VTSFCSVTDDQDLVFWLVLQQGIKRKLVVNVELQVLV